MFNTWESAVSVFQRKFIALITNIRIKRLKIYSVIFTSCIKENKETKHSVRIEIIKIIAEIISIDM